MTEPSWSPAMVMTGTSVFLHGVAQVHGAGEKGPSPAKRM